MKYLFITLLTIVSLQSYAQIIPTPCALNFVPVNTTQAFYDTGGAGGDSCLNGVNGNYTNSGCITTIVLQAPAGDQVNLKFNYLSMYNTIRGWDWIRIYDGDTTSSPLLFDNSKFGADNDGRPANYPQAGCTSFNIPEFCSTGETLLIHFYATGVVNRAGWDAVVSICGQTMPVDMTYFRGDINGVANLYWSTSTEINNDYFIVQRSKDAIDWEEVAKVDGRGTTVEEQHYNVSDANYYDGTTYYRIIQVDFDGTESISEVIALESKPRKDIIIFPNPTSRMVHIRGVERHSIDIYNSLGKLVYTDEGAKYVDLDKLPSGQYYIVVSTDDVRFTERIIKK